VTIIQAMHDSRLFLPVFKDVRTWKAWEVFLKALFALPIEGEEDKRLFQEATGLTEPPKERAREAFAICGRRSGKSFTSAIIACYLACFQNWREILSPGERGMIFILSVDKFQSRIIRDYISEILNTSESFKKLIKKETAEEVELKNQVSIHIKAASFRSLRGFQLLACLADEIAFWRDIESGANPAGEILRAVRPGLLTSGGLLLGISTPYSRSGVLYQNFRDYYGKSGDVLVWKSPSIVMNPTLNQNAIRKELEADPESGRSEWFAEFRSDVSAFIPYDLIESVTIPGRVSLPKAEGVEYRAFCDPSGGRSDSFCLGVSHKGAEGRAVLDVLLERCSPLSPESTVSEFADVLKAYGLSIVVGDRYAAEFVVELFRKQDIFYQASEKTSSEIFLEFLPMITSGRIELLDSKKLRGQLCGLERRTGRSGKDSVAHFVGGHDDAALAACGSLVLAGQGMVRDGLPMFRHEPTLDRESLEKRREQCWLLDKPFKPTPEEAEILAEEELGKKLEEELEKGDGS
jgi:hypothetical protein